MKWVSRILYRGRSIHLMKGKASNNNLCVKRIAEVCERACNYENMVAHGISCRVRIDTYGK